MNTMEGVYFGNFGGDRDLQRILERDCKAVELYWQKESTPTPTHLQNGYVSSEEEVALETASPVSLQEEPPVADEQPSYEYVATSETVSESSLEEQQQDLTFQQPADEGLKKMVNSPTAHHEEATPAASISVVSTPAESQNLADNTETEVSVEESHPPATGTASSGWSLNVDAPEWQPSNHAFCVPAAQQQQQHQHQQQQQQQQQQHMFQANQWVGSNLYHMQAAAWQHGQPQNWQNVTQPNYVQPQFMGTHAYGTPGHVPHSNYVQTSITQHGFNQQGTAMHPSFQQIRHMIPEADFSQPPPGWGTQPPTTQHWQGNPPVTMPAHTQSNNYNTGHTYPAQRRDSDSYQSNIPSNKPFDRRNKKKRNYHDEAITTDSYPHVTRNGNMGPSDMGPTVSHSDGACTHLSPANSHNNVDHQQGGQILHQPPPVPVAVPVNATAVTNTSEVKPLSKDPHPCAKEALDQPVCAPQHVESITCVASPPVISDVQPDCMSRVQPVRQDRVPSQPPSVIPPAHSGVSPVKQEYRSEKPATDSTRQHQVAQPADENNSAISRTRSPVRDAVYDSRCAGSPNTNQAMPSSNPISSISTSSTPASHLPPPQSQTQSQRPAPVAAAAGTTSPPGVAPSQNSLPLDSNANDKASISEEICEVHDKILEYQSKWQKRKEPSSLSKNAIESDRSEKSTASEDERTRGPVANVGLTPMDSQINRTKAHLQGKSRENQVPKIADAQSRRSVETEQSGLASPPSDQCKKPENTMSPPALNESEFPPMSSNNYADFPPIVSDKDEFPPIGSGKVKPKKDTDFPPIGGGVAPRKSRESDFPSLGGHNKRGSKTVRSPQSDSDSEYPAMPSKQDTEQKGKESSGGPASKPKSGGWAALFKGDNEQSSKGTIVYVDPPYKPEDDADYVPQAPPVPSAEDAAATQLGQLLHDFTMNNQPVSLQPRGLINRGNWCYINATLQALLACPPFYNLFKSLPTFQNSQRGPSSTPIIDSMVEFVNQFSLYTPRPAEKSGKVKEKSSLDLFAAPSFEPKNVYKMLNVINSESAFKHGRQEDAEEFLSCVLNGLHDEMVASINFATNGNSGGKMNGETEKEVVVEVEVEEEDDDQWEQVGPKNKSIITRSATLTMSPVSHIFGGQMRSILHQQGSKESATLQPFFTLQLDIQHENIWNIRDCLDQLVSKESLQGFTCTKTKQEVEASRRITLESLPPVLILHLKCFVYDKSGGIQKVIKKIELTDKLDISRDLLSGNVKNKLQAAQRQYKLFAVVNHHGARAIGGHYTADIYHPGINSWLHCDDGNIRPISIQKVLQFQQPKVPYLLYFRRADLG